MIRRRQEWEWMKKKSTWILYWINEGREMGDIKMHIIAPTLCAINMLHILSHYISCTRLPTQSQPNVRRAIVLRAPQTVANFEGCALCIFFVVVRYVRLCADALLLRRSQWPKWRALKIYAHTPSSRELKIKVRISIDCSKVKFRFNYWLR